MSHNVTSSQVIACFGKCRCYSLNADKSHKEDKTFKFTNEFKYAALFKICQINFMINESQGAVLMHHGAFDWLNSLLSALNS